MTEINFTKCFVQKEKHIGYTTHINICSDTEKVIPWTTVDWMGFTINITLVAFLILLVGLWGYMIRDLTR
jgi:hypothetical protein